MPLIYPVGYLGPSSAIGGNDANALLLMHMDGTNGGTSFPDSSASARTVNAVGGTATTSTSVVKYGSASFSTGAAGVNYVEMTPAISTIGTGAYTYDFWIYYDGNQSTAGVAICGNYDVAATSQWLITAGTTLNCVRMANASGGTMFNDTTNALSITTWHHIAFVRQSTSANGCACYKNGTSIGTYTDANNYNSSSKFRVGAQAVGGNAFVGYLDELRVSNIARWTANFTPPAGPYS